MTDMPETIWANVIVMGDFIPLAGEWNHCDTQNDGDTAYRRADLPPKVKPLVWEDRGTHFSAAETALGEAAVQNENTAASPNRWGWWMAGSNEDDFPNGYADGVDAAKAAAQADYESRILSALVTP